jgi:hypothetical protein
MISGCPSIAMLGHAYEIIQLDCSNALVHAVDDLHGDGGSVDVLRVQAIAEPRHSSGDLVELHAFLAAICVTLATVSKQA